MDGSFGLVAENRNNLVVGHVAIDTVFHIYRSKDGSKLTVRAQTLELLLEERNEITGRALFALDSVSYSLVEDRIGVVARDGFYDVRNLNLKRKVHTTLQVKTEVDFVALAFHVGILLEE